MRLRASLFAAVAVMFLASFSHAQCNGVTDKAGVIRNSRVIAAAALPLLNQGVDVHVVTVDHGTFVSNGSSLAGVETAMEANCPSWVDPKTGLRKANLFVVMVAPQDRQKNIFLGSYYAGSFDIPATYSQLANPSFKAGQWETGIANTLNGTGSRAIAFHQQQFAAQQRQRVAPPVQPQQRVYTQQPVYNAPAPQTADSGMSGLAIFLIVVLILGIVGTILYFVFRTTEDATTTYTTSTDTEFAPSPDYSSGRRIGYGGRRIAAAAPASSTVVVHEHYDNSGNNLVTGMLIGEALSRPSYNPNPVYVEQPTYVAPTPTYEAPAPVADAPDSTWEEPTQSAPDTNFDAPSNDFSAPDPPSFDPPSGDSGF
jgi:hypothetical protein